MNAISHTQHSAQDLLLQLICEGDEKAFEQLYFLHKDRVYEIALVYTESPQLSEEILQDVFVQVWTKRLELPSIADFRSWLFIMARNRAFNVLRSVARAEAQLRVLLQQAPATADMADQQLLAADVDLQLREAMKLLTPAQLKAFELFKINGLSREETADAMGISPNTAKVHVMQAMRTIRAYLVGKNVLAPSSLCLAIFIS
ncbi:MAG: sigma-70 family RNA polymerase sigma factor [Candidatus Pseudobacter hemicellulosilyticus]|uniref:Sigma-70 family RNA polymerase sigma factor n=1 Tax=Candidatus Pseudobacter hemicellulosilyticus TaxID=3121375 RepID=A0AAJ5WQ43_9BACT|nr:MAG: sigma-70 family RNA polymerase sigma factor [Pseudobacter sp.]